MTETILIIEDETRIAHWVREYFEKSGFRALTAADGKIGLQMARREHPDLIILDLMLPGMGGMDICRTLRADSDVPIIMLTARGQETDRVVGLELGADDYVVKPFSPAELVARARAVLRRAHAQPRSPQVLRLANITLNPEAHTCHVDDAPVSLSVIQFKLLTDLMQNAGHVRTRQQLANAALDGNYDGYERTIDVHIRRLRQRIEADPANPARVITVFGVGYKFEGE